MLFNVSTDTGYLINGYLVPDGFSESGSIEVWSGGVRLVRVAATEHIPALLNAGRHATGMCGFTIGVSHISDLPELSDLAIFDAETGILIYRRPSARHLQKRIVRIDSHLLPLRSLDDVLSENFRFNYHRIEKYGFETVQQIFHLPDASSLYISGRVLVKSYEHLVGEETNLIILLREPYFELAERILLIRQLGKGNYDNVLGERDNLSLAPAIHFVNELQLSEHHAIRRSFRSMSDRAMRLFANPLTRTLSAKTPDEGLFDGSISTSLDVLASCAVVGFRSQPEIFRTLLSDLAQVPVEALPSLDEYESVTKLGAALSEIKEVADILDKDLQLFDRVLQAYKSVF